MEHCAMRHFFGNAGAAGLGLHLGQQNVTLNTGTRCPKLQEGGGEGGGGGLKGGTRTAEAQTKVLKAREWVLKAGE